MRSRTCSPAPRREDVFPVISGLDRGGFTRCQPGIHRLAAASAGAYLQHNADSKPLLTVSAEGRRDPKWQEGSAQPTGS